MNRHTKAPLLAHAVIVLVLSLATLFILDMYNPLLGFMSSTYTRILLCTLLVLSLILAVKFAGLVRRAPGSSEGKKTEHTESQ